MPNVPISLDRHAPLGLDGLVDSSLQRPAHYLGNELGLIIRDWHQEWDEAHVRWCLTHPKLHELGASNNGYISSTRSSTSFLVSSAIAPKSACPGSDSTTAREPLAPIRS